MDLKPILVADETLAKSTAEILQRETRLGVDCEGVNVGISGEVTLIQIVTSDGEIYLFDVQVCPEIAPILKPILESSSVLKVCVLYSILEAYLLFHAFLNLIIL